MTDDVYQILSRHINIDSERQRYTKLYDHVRKTILDDLKQNDHFKTLFSDEKLCGSYADNLKISKPNEFDIVIRLEFPSQHLVKIHRDPKNKGNVFIDLSDVLTSLQPNIPRENSLLIFLRKMVDGNSMLLENKFQQWFQNLMTEVLTKLNYQIIHQCQLFTLKYRREGPAHNIVGKCPREGPPKNVRNVRKHMPFLSIDFVPGFGFTAQQSVSSRILCAAQWEAIPRPLKGVHLGQIDNPSFRTSYTDSERVIIFEKYQMKNAIRLLKKYRDLRGNMKHLKSYYIKTLFLWINEKIHVSFWNKPIFVVIALAFQRLEDSLKNREIKFFWDDELNLLQNLKPTQIKEMFNEVHKARKTLEFGSKHDILDLFLSAEEQKELTRSEMEILSDNIGDFQQSYK